MVVAIGLLAGCSDPDGAVRRERAAARKSSPTPRPVASKKAPHHGATWWQAPDGVKTANGLRVRTGALRTDRMRIAIIDVGSHARRTITATATPHGATVGRFTLTGIKVAKSPKTGTTGVTFHYRWR
jgi:hypothetical protein